MEHFKKSPNCAFWFPLFERGGPKSTRLYGPSLKKGEFRKCPLSWENLSILTPKGQLQCILIGNTLLPLVVPWTRLSSPPETFRSSSTPRGEHKMVRWCLWDAWVAEIEGGAQEDLRLALLSLLFLGDLGYS